MVKNIEDKNGDAMPIYNNNIKTKLIEYRVCLFFIFMLTINSEIFSNNVLGLYMSSSFLLISNGIIILIN